MAEQRRAVPLVRSQGVTVEVRAVDVESCSFDHVLGDHAEPVQHVAELTARRGTDGAPGQRK